jgi:hypothetical protein
MDAALRALRARKGAPTEADAPPPSTFPGRKPKLIPGQLALGEQPTETDPTDGESTVWTR